MHQNFYKHPVPRLLKNITAYGPIKPDTMKAPSLRLVLTFCISQGPPSPKTEMDDTIELGKFEEVL